MGSSIKRELSVTNDNSTFIRSLAIGVIAVIVFLSLPQLCMSHKGDFHDDHIHDHDHDHDHYHHHESNEPPSFKYSRQANENFQKNDKIPNEKQHNHHPHDNHDHGEHIHDHGHTKVKENVAEKDISSIWLHSMGSTLLISAAPYLVLFTIPLDNTERMKPRLKVLLAFASGGLLGDAFLHLIPHSAVPHSHHDHSHDHHGHSHEHNHHHHHHHNDSHDESGHDHSHDMSVGLWVLSGIIAFLAVEKGVRLIKGGDGHSHGGGNHHHHHHHNDHSKEKDNKKDNKKNDIKNKLNKISNQKEKEKGNEQKSDEVEVAGYLNLAADFAHNFTDGLAIGASYLAGKSIGIVTTVTILFHEIPHEIGDFAILIKSGCTRRKAIYLQLVTALGALAGTALALLGAGSDAAASWVLPFTAGGFIYIATVSVLPELLEGPTKLGQSLREISALLTGVALMVVIANFE